MEMEEQHPGQASQCPARDSRLSPSMFSSSSSIPSRSTTASGKARVPVFENRGQLPIRALPYGEKAPYSAK